jgi:hypothetical protein
MTTTSTSTRLSSVTGDASPYTPVFQGDRDRVNSAA